MKLVKSKYLVLAGTVVIAITTSAISNAAGAGNGNARSNLHTGHTKLEAYLRTLTIKDDRALVAERESRGEPVEGLNSDIAKRQVFTETAERMLKQIESSPAILRSSKSAAEIDQILNQSNNILGSMLALNPALRDIATLAIDPLNNYALHLMIADVGRSSNHGLGPKWASIMKDIFDKIAENLKQNKTTRFSDLGPSEKVVLLDTIVDAKYLALFLQNIK